VGKHAGWSTKRKGRYFSALQNVAIDVVDGARSRQRVTLG
jgi:hypothetical protein